MTVCAFPMGTFIYLIYQILLEVGMALIKWRNSYSVGVAKFDQEHMLLVELINEMFEIVRDKGEVASLTDAVEKLVDYTRVHFSDEEEAMEKVNYPHLEEHKEIHANLLEQVVEFQKQIEHEGKDLRTDLYKFLREWLINHILDEDMRYGKYFKDDLESVAAVSA